MNYQTQVGFCFFLSLFCLSANGMFGLFRTPSVYDFNQIDELSRTLQPMRRSRLHDEGGLSAAISPDRINPAVLANYYVRVMNMSMSKLNTAKLAEKHLRCVKKKDPQNYDELVRGVLRQIEHENSVDLQSRVRAPAGINDLSAPVTPVNSIAGVLHDLENPSAIQQQLPINNRLDSLFINNLSHGISEQIYSQTTSRQRMLIGAVVANIVQLAVWFPSFFKK